jgi:hypothetical protein
VSTYKSGYVKGRKRWSGREEGQKGEGKELVFTFLQDLRVLIFYNECVCL